jgi:hypothetical protein
MQEKLCNWHVFLITVDYFFYGKLLNYLYCVMDIYTYVPKGYNYFFEMERKFHNLRANA